MIPLSADFTWTPDELRLMRNAWLRFTTNGRSHRRNVWFMFLTGIAGVMAALIWGLDFHGSMLMAASVAMLGFLFVGRMRATQEVRCRAEVHWEISPDCIVVDIAGKKEEFEWTFITRILRTPEGFLMWRRDGFEMWLPFDAFAYPDAVEGFSRIAQSTIEKYGHAA